MEKERKGFFARLKEGLTKTREQLTQRVEELVHYYKEIDDDFFDELTDILVASDLGVANATDLVERVRAKVKAQKIGRPDAIHQLIREGILEQLGETRPLELPNGSVILMVGVNGTGKTTSAGKLAAKFKEEGKSVMLAAADTFRAAAADQLEIWSQRADVPMIRHGEGADPASVVYDAIASQKAHHTDLLICDTAGRLHNKKNLMAELEKICRIVERERDPHGVTETWLVVDATTGQNGLAQARLFAEAAHITGIVLTKLDGTAKGGVVVAIARELGVPVRFVGVGEKLEDLQPFDPVAFAQAII